MGNSNNSDGIIASSGIVLNTVAESARQTSKVVYKRGTLSKTAAQITKENAAIWGNAATKLNVAGGIIGAATSTYGAAYDFSQGNKGWGWFNVGKAASYFVGTALIFVPVPGARVAAGYILTTTTVVDVGGSVIRNR